MALELLPPRIRGYAVFGTAHGLSVQGSGVLVDGDHFTAIFDFAAGRRRDGHLQMIAPNDSALFRRRVIDLRGNPLELLGVLSPCRDLQGRVGFFGACVAMDADVLRPVPALFDWVPAFKFAQELRDKAEKGVDAGNGRFTLPREQLVPQSGEAKAGQLTCAAETEAILFVEGREAGEALDQLQGLALTVGQRFSTVILLPRAVEGAVSLFDSQFGDAARELDRRVAETLTRLRQEEEAQREAEEAAARRAAAPPTPPAARPGAARPSATLDAETRLLALEREVREMRQDLWQLRRLMETQPGGTSSRRAPAPSQASQSRPAPAGLSGCFGAQDFAETWIERHWIALIAAGSGLLLAVCLGITLWILFADSGEDATAAVRAEPAATATPGYIGER
ncbi:hypothetical protein LAZ40_02140 [Cereibacter sphaeroides]|uniref:hypothetical protein n=1 Tax=Cereibacter sphaeroides TaxID=1063 RepID=UPI001F3F2883|nr:hypothetical protein [Cereibacter sphaeroides]MCE6957857.1 hypothetical protein [Cereibacter sphaeroides]MCE6971826.1 hypothetical protein [Cereibacter sphaeroides]